MPVIVPRSLSEVDESEHDEDHDRERDVHFFLPSSRRQSEEDAVANSRPRAFAMNEDSTMNFLLFHTFQLPYQTGPSQVALLPATKTIGIRILVACRDDCFRLFYFQMDDSEDETTITPKARTISSLPVEKGWKIGTVSLVPKPSDPATTADQLAYIMYWSPSKDHVTPNSEKLNTSLLAVASLNDQEICVSEEDFQPDSDETLTQEKDSLSQDEATTFGGRLTFLPHGCNQLIWWNHGHTAIDTTLSLLIPGQDEHLYATTIPCGARQESCNLVFTDVFDAIPVLNQLSHLASVNAFEYVDVSSDTGDITRIIAVSHKSRAEIVVGSLNLQTKEWTQFWTAQHDSMTSRMRFFPRGDDFDLLVIGLCETAVIYQSIVSASTKRPKATVLPDSNRHDLVTCCDIVDVDSDGQLEIILGTYGRMVLIYKLFEDKEPALVHRIETAFPVHYVAMAALTGDHTNELLVITQKGVNVYCFFQ